MKSPSDAYRAKSLEPRKLGLFFLLSFAWSWFWWFLFISDVVTMPAGIGTQNADLGSAGPVILLILVTPYGPTLAAFLLTALSDGKEGVRELWGRFWRRRPSLGWLAVIVLLFPAIRLLANLFGQLGGEPMPLLVYPKSPWMAIPPFIASIINGGLSEEFGWRGYALPRLQARWNALTASAILGVIEGLWHAPLLLMEGQRHESSLVEMVLWLSVGIIFRTWVFNNTGGSIMAAVLLHAMGNTASEITYCCAQLSHLYAATIIVALLVVVIFGPETMIRGRKERGEPILNRGRLASP